MLHVLRQLYVVLCVCFVILEPRTVKNELNSQYNRAFIAALKQSSIFV